MKIIDKIKLKLISDSRNKSNKKIKKLLYSIDKRFVDLNLSDKSKSWYNELLLNGIVKIDNDFEWVQKYYEKNYFNNNKNIFFLKDLIDDRAKKTGRIFAKAISLNDENLYDWYFNHDLIGLMGKIYNQQPFYRNQPIIQTYAFDEEHSQDIAGKWHIDGGLNQITFMLLINNIDENDTHMQFALKSTKNEYKELNRNKVSHEKIINEFDIMKCIGNAGTLYIFQGGLGYHRAVYKKKSIRSIYHVNFTPGHDIQNNGLQKKKDIPNLSNEPFFIQQCANLILS